MADVGNGTAPDVTGSQRDLRYSVIAMSITAAVVLVTIVLIWAIWWKLCKSPRSKHGNERAETRAPAVASRKRDYYDQFNVNDHQLTINSVTAIKWDQDAERGSVKSSGIDCDSHSGDSREEKKVVGAKKVFSVNKVSEKPAPRCGPGNGGVVIRLPKEYSDITRSLQSGTGKNYTLAIIDRHSNTVHNIDMRNYRVRKSASPLPQTVGGARPGQPPRLANKRQRHRSDGQARHAAGVESAAEMLHDSPDFAGARRQKRGTMSADERETRPNGHSSTDMSDSSSRDGRTSVSLSSHDEEDRCPAAPAVQPLVQATPPSAPHARRHDSVPSDSEKENLLENYQ